MKELIPKSKDYKKWLRRKLLQNWIYAKHYVDSAVKIAYSILKSRKKNYLIRKKPKVKGKFVRVLAFT